MTSAWTRDELEAMIPDAVGQPRIRLLKKWIETFSCKDHRHESNDDTYKSRTPGQCDACSLQPAAIKEEVDSMRLHRPQCYTCDLELCDSCAGVDGTCVLCLHKETFFVTCACGIDECYNYWGMNPTMDTYFLCKRHKQPVADRCVQRVKCSTCRNTVSFPLCEKCYDDIPNQVRCKTCLKWTP